MSAKYIVIEGNIGSGKSTLTNALAARHNIHPVLEAFEDNAFLPLFYKQPKRYAFPLEMSFLAERYEQLKRELLHPDLFKTLVLSDYMLAKCRIFAGVNLEEPELSLYRDFYTIVSDKLPQPDLVIYLHSEPAACLNRIRSRGRSYEQEIPLEYLTAVQTGYLDYFAKASLPFPVLMIDREEYDFVNNPEDVDRIDDLTKRSFAPGVHRITGI